MQYVDAHPEWGIGRAASEAGNAAAFAEYWPAVSRAIACQQRLLDAAHRPGVGLSDGDRCPGQDRIAGVGHLATELRG